MRAFALDDSQLLDTWDRAASLHRPWRELGVLASASNTSVEELARLPIGERDRRLLRLRIGVFGAQLECETLCPQCDTRLELSVDAQALLVPDPTVHDADFELSDENVTVRFRLPNSVDIDACASDNVEASANLLAERCIAVVASREPLDSTVVLARLRDRVGERMAALDAQADVTFDVRCAACQHAWQSPFDPAAFLMADVEAYVARLTSEVHVLARAYGWAESSILAMSATRRQRYLALVAQ